jgi:subtilisin family serine protease
MFFLFSLLSVVFIGGVAASGGGGGGGSSGSTGSNNASGSKFSYSYTADPTWDSAANPTQITFYKTSEYNNQWGLNSIKAAEAYSLLQTNSKNIAGDGIKIGIIDSGVLSTHDKIAGNYQSSGSSTPTDIEGHGTHVASTAAGVKNDDFLSMHGVAFNSKIISINLLGTNAGSDGGEAGIISAANAGAKVVNMSWGYVNSVTGDPIYVNSTTDSNYISTKNDLSSEFASAVANDVVMAVAIGNDGRNDTTHVMMPALFAVDSITNEQMIAVGSVDKNNNISVFSNHCSQVKDFCLVAPGGLDIGAAAGQNIYAAGITSNSSYVENLGTSMATPHVAGAAAVLRAAWSYLTAYETVRILLDTATDLGAAGVDDVYGHGLLNLENAVSAQGANNISSSTSVSSAGYDARSSSIGSNPIFGNAFNANVAPILKNAVFFDKYGRDYKANLDQKISVVSNNSYSLDNLMFNDYSSANLPMSFGNNYSNNLAVRFNARNLFEDPISGQMKTNRFGLKHLTIDNSKEDQNGFGDSDVSFAYAHNFGQGLKMGFSKNDFNGNFNQENPAKNYNLISYNNFVSSPYKNLSANAGNNFGSQSQISTNQLSISQKLTSNLTSSLSFSNYNQSNSISKFSSDESRVFDSSLAYKINQKTKIGFSLGNLNEMNNNFLGSKNQGAFSSGSDPSTKFATFNATRDLTNNWQITASYSEGKTDVSGNDLGVFRDFSDIKSRGSAIGILNNNFFGGSLALVYSEPLRVYSGSANLDIPISRDADGNVQRLTANGVSLRPDGKEQDLEISYSSRLKYDRGTINFNSLIRQEPDNIKGAKNQYLMMVRYNLEF